MSWNPDEEAAYVARRRRRNIAIGVVLGLFALLFYGITVSRVAG
jgi:hypothetical protein